MFLHSADAGMSVGSRESEEVSGRDRRESHEHLVVDRSPIRTRDVELGGADLLVNSVSLIKRDVVSHSGKETSFSEREAYLVLRVRASVDDVDELRDEGKLELLYCSAADHAG